VVDGPVLVLARRLVGAQGTQWAISGFNSGEQALTVDVPLPPDMADARFIDVLTPSALPVSDGRLRLHLPARYGAVVVSQDPMAP